MKYLLFILLTFVSEISSSQEIKPPMPTKQLPKPLLELTEFPDKAAEFNGGEKALDQFITDNIVYPIIAINNDIQGTVELSFIVAANGTIGDIQIVKSVSRELDRESIRVLKEMPNWIPAELNGKAVNVRQSLPFVYTIN